MGGQDRYRLWARKDAEWVLVPHVGNKTTTQGVGFTTAHTRAQEWLALGWTVAIVHTLTQATITLKCDCERCSNNQPHYG